MAKFPTGADDYLFTTVLDGVRVDGRIMPLRETSETGPSVLRAEDVAFLVEGLEERVRVLDMGWGSWKRFGSSDSDWPFHGMPSQLVRPILFAGWQSAPSGIADMFGVRTRWAYTFGGGYATFIRPDRAQSWPADFSLGEYRSVVDFTGDTLEDRLIDVAEGRTGFTPRNDPGMPLTLDGKRLDRVVPRRAFRDLKQLRYVLSPATLDPERSRVHMASQRGYDATPPAGSDGYNLYDETMDRHITLAVVPYATQFGGGSTGSVSFPDIGCYCSCTAMSERDSCNSVYMSEKGNVDSSGDSEGVICCASSVNVWAEDSLVLAPIGALGTGVLGIGLPSLSDIRKVIVVYRVWHRLSSRGGDGSDPLVMVNRFVAVARPAAGLKIKLSWIDPEYCQGLLASSGLPPVIVEHPDPEHTHSCGVDIAGIYVLSEPDFRTDLRNIDCPA